MWWKEGSSSQPPLTPDKSTSLPSAEHIPASFNLIKEIPSINSSSLLNIDSILLKKRIKRKIIKSKQKDKIKL